MHVTGERMSALDIQVDEKRAQKGFKERIRF